MHITASIAGSTARVTGYAPEGFTGPLPFYAQSSQDAAGTLITVVYPIATAAIGTKNPDGSPVMNRPGTYPNLVVTPFKTEGSPSEWGGFPYMEYNHVHEDAFHGPISYPVAEQWQLRRGPVSHGCSRMQGEHAVELANLIGIDMLEARRSPTQESSDETAEAASKGDDAGIVPLGIPMLAGPGAISSVMILVGQALKTWELAVVLGAIALTAGLSYLILTGANRVRSIMGETGIRILVRIMGLLLVALAVQFFINGLTDLGLIAKVE